MSRYEMGFIDQVLAACDVELPDIVFTLDEDVDQSLLDQAINRAIEAHPIFCCAIRSRKGWYYLESNEDSKTWPWSIRISGPRVIFTGSHALTDGAGAFRFMEAVTRGYYELKGLGFESAKSRVPKSSGDAISEDPYRCCADRDRKYSADTGRTEGAPEKANHIPAERSKAKYEKVCSRQFVFDEEEIRKLSQKSETSTFAIIASILAKAFAEAAEITDGVIDTCIATNLRLRANWETDRCFSVSPELKYDIEAGRKMSLTDRAKDLRRQFDLQINEEAVRATIRKMDENGRKFKRIPGALWVTSKVYNRMRYTDRAKFTYSHMTRPGIDPQLMEHLECVQIVPRLDSRKRIHLAFATTFKGKIYLNISSALKDELWAKAIRAELDELQISYQMNELAKR